MKYYAVLDTNVIVSYFLTRNSGSTIVKLIDSFYKGLITPLYNDAIVDEYKGVLLREKFGIKEENAIRLIEDIKKNGINCQAKTVSEVFPDPDDIVFYEVALSRDDSYLVTGNLKHFPKNGRVVSPKDMLEIIAFGELRNDTLSETEPPLYLPIPLEEINAIIAEVRRTRL